MENKVAAIIVNWRHKEATKECVESLLASGEEFYKIFIVDNNSNDGSVSFLKSYFASEQKIEILETKENLGFGGGANFGIKKALEDGASFVLILNNDTIFEKDFFPPLLLEFKIDSSVGIVAPKICFLEDKNIIWYLGGRINLFLLKVIHNFIGKEVAPENSFETEFASGCALLVKKEVFEKIGFFKEKYFMFWEDADFSYLARKAGFRIIVAPKAKIFHAESASLNDNGQKIYYLTRNGLIFGKENYPPYLLLWLYFYLLCRFAYNFFRRFLGQKKGEAWMVYQAYVDFLKGREGKI